MFTRTSRRVVTFAQPFTLSGIDGVQPAGSYTVETDEELVDGLSFPVYRRLSTIIVIPGRPGEIVSSQSVAVDPDELAEAERRDATG
ncbi:hypothetical protein AZL_011310 [Azospirillum sp. B510]|nr:hypothetical protein AZL_011310 [Azospirillum sp. B510]